MAKQENSRFLSFLYHNFLGRCLLKILTLPFISKLCGFFLDSKLSKFLIKPFIRNNNININDYDVENINSFNDFFTRKIKAELRPISRESNDFICPCDGLLSAYKIDKDLVMPIKQSSYSIKSLLQDEKLAQKYVGGICLVFRLCVNHYHRYCYIDNGHKKGNTFIKGRLHTVRPIALESLPVFVQNSREYTTLNTDNFGDVTQIEVGAMLVGKIKNHHQSYEFMKGEEKGMFLYGGSTIVILVEKDRVNFLEDFFKNTNEQIETPVVMGQIIGTKIK